MLSVKVVIQNGPTHQVRPCGLMDKAPDFGSGDCRFESCHGRIFCHDMTLIFCCVHIGNIQFITRSMVKLCILSLEALLYSLMFCPFDHVEQCGTMWNNVEQCGTEQRDEGQSIHGCAFMFSCIVTVILQSSLGIMKI